jgi:phospholipase/carboxylesterase
MNRLQLPALEAPVSTSESSDGITSARFVASQSRVPFSLFAPLHYESNYAYPLIVWLHGPGDDERQLRRIMPLVSMRNYVAVAPRAPGDGGGRASAWRQTEADIMLAEQRIFDSLSADERRFNFRRDRVFLAGYDCGGTMAFRIAMQHPDKFAGVLSIGGGFPCGRTPLSRLSEARRMPIFLATGRDSRKYPQEKVCDDLRLFHAAGMSVSLRQYPCGQEIAIQMLGDLDRWIMEQIGSGA